MHRRAALRALILAAFALVLVGCGPPWKPVLQASPNPFLGQQQFAVFPVTFQALQVGDGGEQEYLADKDGEERASWDEDKAALNDRFTASLVEHAAEAGVRIALATGPAAAPFFVRANVTFVEPGVYTVFVNIPTTVKMTVQITAPNGLVLDEVLFRVEVPASLGNAASGTRIRQAAEGLGHQVAAYLDARIRGEEE